MMWRLILAFIQAADNSSRFLQCCPPRKEGQVHNNCTWHVGSCNGCRSQQLCSENVVEKGSDLLQSRNGNAGPKHHVWNQVWGGSRPHTFGSRGLLAMRLRFWLNLSNSTRNRCTSARNSRCSYMAAIKTSALCFWCKLLNSWPQNNNGID